jgi:hypothetical protein
LPTLSVQSDDLCDTYWLVDSGALRHLSRDRRRFYRLLFVPPGHTIQVVDGRHSPITSQGEVTGVPNMRLTDILLVLDFSISLLLVSRITNELNCQAIFDVVACTF